MSFKVYKFRIYPTKAQETVLEQTLETCRRVYNKTLALRKDIYEKEHRSISLFETHKLLTQWKKEDPIYLKQVNSQVLQNVQYRVDLAFKSFFRRVKQGKIPGYPRFKGIGRYDSITYPQLGVEFKLKSETVNLSKIGKVKVHQHREVEGNPKTCTVLKTYTGKWFISICCEQVMKIKPEREFKSVGIDLGVISLCTLSNGDEVQPPRYLIQDEKILAKAQRKLSAAEKGSKLRSKRRKIVAHIHEKISNKRKDFHEKLSLSLVQTYSFIVFEDLKVDEMVQKPDCYVEKYILDAAWSQLVTKTQHKAEEAGATVVLVNPCNTTKMCSQCRTLVPKERDEMVHNCPVCGLTLGRDHNAAINILRLGLQSVGLTPRCSPI
jgi:putative transposase